MAIHEPARHIYDANGNYRGSVSSISPQDYRLAGSIGELLPLAILGAIVWWAWGMASTWNTLEQPYKYIAAYYYWIIVVPLKGFVPAWGYFASMQVSNFPNINLIIQLVLGVFGVLLYFFLLILGLGVVGAILKACRLQRWWSTFLFGPLVFAILWFLGAQLFNWLLAK